MADEGAPGGRVHYRVRAAERSALLAEGEVVIGRSAYCSLVLDHETLSRIHATLRIAGDGGVILSDEGSSNGTFVNGARIGAPIAVGPDDEIRLGSVIVTLEIEAPRQSAETGRFPLVGLDDTRAPNSTTAVPPKAERA